MFIRFVHTSLAVSMYEHSQSCYYLLFSCLFFRCLYVFLSTRICCLAVRPKNLTGCEILCLRLKNRKKYLKVFPIQKWTLKICNLEWKFAVVEWKITLYLDSEWTSTSGPLFLLISSANAQTPTRWEKHFCRSLLPPFAAVCEAPQLNEILVVAFFVQIVHRGFREKLAGQTLHIRQKAASREEWTTTKFVRRLLQSIELSFPLSIVP